MKNTLGNLGSCSTPRRYNHSRDNLDRASGYLLAGYISRAR